MSVFLPHDHGHNNIDELLASMNSESFSELSELFSMLSDPTRLKTFWILCHSEECVINLSAIMNMSSPAVSHHLRQLKKAELIVSRREGKEVYYRSADTNKAKLLHDMTEDLVKLSCPDTSCHFK